jgi:methylenetetrahydrofolate--tRNA-(uracil-5-)-methyltransferase
MRRCGSLILRCADAHQLPAGGALAVDRNGFAAAVTAAVAGHSKIEIVREEIAGLPPEEWDNVIIAPAASRAPPATKSRRVTFLSSDMLAYPR